MRRFSEIRKQVITATVAVTVGAVTLLGGAAHAETVQQRAQAEMNNGRDYAAAHQIASRELGSVYSPDLATHREDAEAAMNRGKDYIAAWETTSHRVGAFFSAEQIAKAKQAATEINQGKDYVAAWESTRKEPAVIEATELGRVTAGSEQATSTK